MKRPLIFLALFALLALGLVFASLNSMPVRINYYLGTTEGPVAVVMVAALALGAGLGVLAALGLLLKQKRENARLRRKCELCEQEIRNLRQIPINDRH